MVFYIETLMHTHIHAFKQTKQKIWRGKKEKEEKKLN